MRRLLAHTTVMPTWLVWALVVLLLVDAIDARRWFVVIGFALGTAVLLIREAIIRRTRREQATP